MKKLGMVLPNINNISKQRDSATSMQQPGCSTMDGNKTTQSNNLEVKKQTKSQVIKTDSTKHLQKEKPEQTQCLTLRESKQATQQLSILLRQCFNVLGLYGKKPEQLADIVSAFGMVLADYMIQDITEAFKEHLRTSSVMPTPADIVKIIEPELGLTLKQVMEKRHPTIVEERYPTLYYTIMLELEKELGSKPRG